MAVDFNGATSKVENTGADLAIGSVCTLVIWERAVGVGEGTAGGIISLDETPSPTFFLSHGAATANVLSFFSDHSVNNGHWNIPATDGQWNAIALRYDLSSVTNDPVARVNFLPVTATEITAPSGTPGTVLPGYCIGNLSNQSLTWDGSLAHVQVFNVLLTNAEMDQALRLPGSVRRGLKLWLPLYSSAYLADLSGLRNNATGTALTNIVGGPPCGFLGSESYVLSIGVIYSVSPISMEPDFEIKSPPLFTSSVSQDVDTAEYGFEALGVRLPRLEDLDTFGAEFGFDITPINLTFFLHGGTTEARTSRVSPEDRRHVIAHEPRFMIGAD